MSKRIESPVERRSVVFKERVRSAICEEVPGENPYLAAQVRCGGYDVLELVQSRTFVDYLYLLLVGELPTRSHAVLLEKLMMVLANPGPRHPAVYAAMTAAVSKAKETDYLPIGIGVLSGENNGAAMVREAVSFLRENYERPVRQVAEELLANPVTSDGGDRFIAPGFGTRYGSIDMWMQEAASILVSFGDSEGCLHWSNTLVSLLLPHGYGWLQSGLAAAVFVELGVPVAATPGLFQLLCAPGILVHAAELADKPLTAMPFLDDENYEIRRR